MSGNQKFGAFLRAFRLRSGFGLREFAEMIGEQSSNLSAIETGRRQPWRSDERLEEIAAELKIEKGSRDWDEFFIAARRELPPDVCKMLDRQLVAALLRAVDENSLTNEQLQELIAHVRKQKPRRRPKRRVAAPA